MYWDKAICASDKSLLKKESVLRTSGNKMRVTKWHNAWMKLLNSRWEDWLVADCLKLSIGWSSCIWFGTQLNICCSAVGKSTGNSHRALKRFIRIDRSSICRELALIGKRCWINCTTLVIILVCSSHNRWHGIQSWRSFIIDILIAP